LDRVDELPPEYVSCKTSLSLLTVSPTAPEFYAATRWEGRTRDEEPPRGGCKPLVKHLHPGSHNLQPCGQGRRRDKEINRAHCEELAQQEVSWRNWPTTTVNHFHQFSERKRYKRTLFRTSLQILE
jgi:hypothetical protein